MTILLKEKPALKKAHKEYLKFTQDEYIRDLYDTKLKREMDAETYYGDLVEKAEIKGIEKGIEKGELFRRQSTLIRQLDKKFGISKDEEEEIKSCNDSFKLDTALDEFVFATDKSSVLEKLK